MHAFCFGAQKQPKNRNNLGYTKNVHNKTNEIMLTNVAIIFSRNCLRKLSVPMRKRNACNKYTLTLKNMNPNVKVMQYAVRGPLLIRAAEIEKELEKGTDKGFKQVIRGNIGDAHAMGQVPITFFRQVLALVLYPPLLESPDYPEDAKERACALLSSYRGRSAGSYTESPGIELIRRQVAKYIEKRDDGIKSEWQNIILSAGASEGIKNVLKMMVAEVDCKPPGVMIPIPQYPLYSATLAEFNVQQIKYYLDEEKNWALDICELKRSLEEARGNDINARALVVINPGNPTGQVLTKDNIESIIEFAQENKLFLLADEVYQDNIYGKNSEFHSFKKVMMEMGDPYKKMELASFMSCSKGYVGECGLRGGYTELVNIDPEVMTMFNKCISAMLCPTVIGQSCMYLVTNPPVEGEPSYEQYNCERCAVLDLLKKRAKMVVETLNSLEGFSCNEVQGAMYAFPQIKLPKQALEEAKKNKQAGDVFYAFQLLEKTGVCIIPGTGFMQREGTYHFRTTILPQPELLKDMLGKIASFHNEFIAKYK